MSQNTHTTPQFNFKAVSAVSNLSDFCAPQITLVSESRPATQNSYTRGSLRARTFAAKKDAPSSYGNFSCKTDTG